MTRRIASVHGHPFTGGTKRFGQVHLAHRRDQIGAQFRGPVRALDGCDVQPSVSRNKVHRAATTCRIHQPHVAEGIGASLTTHRSVFGILHFKACHHFCPCSTPVTSSCPCFPALSGTLLI